MSTSLTQLITEKHVVLGVRPQSWQDANRLAAAPLAASASVTDQYIDRMIEVVETYGPYIVLAPGVALAHAQPDGSVARTAMSAMTIPEGVPFGHDGNAPVRLIGEEDYLVGLLDENTTPEDLSLAVARHLSQRMTGTSWRWCAESSPRWARTTWWISTTSASSASSASMRRTWCAAPAAARPRTSPPDNP